MTYACDVAHSGNQLCPRLEIRERQKCPDCVNGYWPKETKHGAPYVVKCATCKGSHFITVTRYE